MDNRDDAGIVRLGRRCLTMAQLLERSSRAAMGFTQMGQGQGSTIAVLLRNDIAFLETVLAANQIGAYWVPINWHQTASEIRYILADCQATALVAHSDLLHDAQNAIPEGIHLICVPTPEEVTSSYGISGNKTIPEREWLQWEPWLDRHQPLRTRSASSPGTMVYTSGTTGVPKGIKRQPVLPQKREEYASLRMQWFGHRPGMRTAIIGPLYHSVQASYALATVTANGSIFLLPKFDPETVLRIIEAEKLTHLHLVPTMMIRLLQLPESIRKKYDLSSLEFVIHGAAPCPPEVKRMFIEWWGPVIYEYYGTSEAGMVSRSNSQEWLERVGTVGRPWPGRTIRIYAPDGSVAPTGQEGEVYMSLGLVPDFTYHNANDKRQAAERDGLVTNGDIGYLDEDGYLYLCDRKIDMIVSGGVNIYPAEVEAVLATHPSVLDCAVFGVPDHEFGEAVAAVVQLRDHCPVSREELREFLRPRLAGYKIPRRMDFRDNLPRDDSGKIFKRVLREPYWRAANRRI